MMSAAFVNIKKDLSAVIVRRRDAEKWSFGVILCCFIWSDIYGGCF